MAPVRRLLAGGGRSRLVGARRDHRLRPVDRSLPDRHATRVDEKPLTGALTCGLSRDTIEGLAGIKEMRLLLTDGKALGWKARADYERAGISKRELLKEECPLAS